MKHLVHFANDLIVFAGRTSSELRVRCTILVSDNRRLAFSVRSPSARCFCSREVSERGNTLNSSSLDKALNHVDYTQIKNTKEDGHLRINSSSRNEETQLKIHETENTKSYFSPAFNFAAYVNDSPTLQQLVKLGVSLYKWERKKEVAECVLKLDFKRDMAQYIKFLHDAGVHADNLGSFLTTNPYIFKEDLDDLNVRINYLESKKFSSEMIGHIVSTNPYWLMFSTQRIDRRLGYFQTTFRLRGNEVRQLAFSQPRLITYNMQHIQTNTFVLREELGVMDEELKTLLLTRPKLWMINQVALKNRFEYVHLEMKLPHELIAKNPEVLCSRLFRIKERHLFLKSLKRDQYDPKLEGYISLKSLVSGTNSEFVVNVAKASVDTFNMFLKTL